jgi:hypothetical protein
MQPMPAAVTAWRKSSFSQRGDRRHLVDTAEPLPTPASRPPTSWANRDRRSLCDERLAVGPILGRIAESREDQGPQRLAVSRRADRRGVVTGPVGCQPPRLNFGAKADRPKYLLAGLRCVTRWARVGYRCSFELVRRQAGSSGVHRQRPRAVRTRPAECRRRRCRRRT